MKRRSSMATPYKIIALAAEGDIAAMSAVIKHYNAYMAKLASYSCTGSDGVVHYNIDVELSDLLRDKLLSVTINFDPKKVKIKKEKNK
jgi:hypothetical protein